MIVLQKKSRNHWVFVFVVVVGIKRMVTNDIFMGKTHYFF